MNYKPKIQMNYDETHEYGCLQTAFRQAGFDIGNSLHVMVEDVPEICRELGLIYYPPDSHFEIWGDTSVIVIEHLTDIWDHATYYEKFSDYWNNRTQDNLCGIIIIP